MPLSSPAGNRKLLAICVAQTLTYVANDLHDTFLPLFQRDVLCMSNTSLGSLHALLQLLPPVLGIISGRLADLHSPARVVIVSSIVTAALSKPMFALCGGMRAWLGASACLAWVAVAKVQDRIVKGVRETPTKALIAELSAGDHGSAAAAFSLRQAFSTLGMLLGAAAAGLAYRLSGGNYEATFVLSTIPAALAAAMLAYTLGSGAGSSGRAGATPAAAVDHAAAAGHPASAAGAGAAGEQRQGGTEQGGTDTLSLAGKLQALLGAFQPAYWQALLTVWLLYLSRFDIAFRNMHASTVMDKAAMPYLAPLSMLPVILLATPFGIRARAGVRARNTILAAGIVVMIAGDLCFAAVPSALGMALGSLCLGLHLAMTQGVLLGMLSAYMPTQHVPGVGRITATAWSLTDLVLGAALALASAVAGWLSDLTLRRGMGSTGCFLGASAAGAASLAALLAFSTWGELGKEQHAMPAQP